MDTLEEVEGANPKSDMACGDDETIIDYDGQNISLLSFRDSSKLDLHPFENIEFLQCIESLQIYVASSTNRP